MKQKKRKNKIENWPCGGSAATVPPLGHFANIANIVYMGRLEVVARRLGFTGRGISPPDGVSGQGLMRGLPPCAARFFLHAQFYRGRVSIPGYGSESAVESWRENTGGPAREPIPKTKTQNDESTNKNWPLVFLRSDPTTDAWGHTPESKPALGRIE